MGKARELPVCPPAPAPPGSADSLQRDVRGSCSVLHQGKTPSLGPPGPCQRGSRPPAPRGGGLRRGLPWVLLVEETGFPSRVFGPGGRRAAAEWVPAVCRLSPRPPAAGGDAVPGAGLSAPRAARGHGGGPGAAGVPLLGTELGGGPGARPGLSRAWLPAVPASNFVESFLPSRRCSRCCFYQQWIVRLSFYFFFFLSFNFSPVLPVSLLFVLVVAIPGIACRWQVGESGLPARPRSSRVWGMCFPVPWPEEEGLTPGSLSF